MNVMKQLEIPKHKIKATQITNSSEVLSWGGCPKKTILEDSLVSKPKKTNTTTTTIAGRSWAGGGVQRLCQDCFLLFLFLVFSPKILLGLFFLFFWFSHQRVF